MFLLISCIIIEDYFKKIILIKEHYISVIESNATVVYETVVYND